MSVERCLRSLATWANPDPFSSAFVVKECRYV
jgi:hypothetical protein